MRSLGLLTLRAVAGTVLIAHGYTKLFGGRGRAAPEWMQRFFGKNFESAVERTGPEGFSEMLEQIEVPAARPAAYLSGLAECGGGLSFLLGLKTRIAAPAVLFNMATAIRKVHWKNGFFGEGGYEFPLTLAGAAATLLMTGPGTLSLDALRSASKHHGGAQERSKS